MSQKTIFFVLCIVSVFQHGKTNWIEQPARCNNIARPDFLDVVKRGFKTAHYGNPRYDVNSVGMSLNHVLSWRAIKQRLSKELQEAYGAPPNRREQYRRKVANFINQLFSIDQDAVVRSENTGYVRIPSVQDHADYLNAGGANLGRVNNDILTRAMRRLNGMNFGVNVDCGEITSLLEDLFNSPANLRYGGVDKLEDLLDPMGDVNGVMTKKEHRWYVQDKYYENHGPSGINGGYYLESSTGKKIRGHTTVPLSNRKLYWIRCFHNNRTCRP